mmetsp:Transcript_38181/g.105254  ORF Transcript_38181/g.105254 Transcript_38181/m.105254 type:complete len:591 (+) Transcript_38181:53-1825(+)
MESRGTRVDSHQADATPCHGQLRGQGYAGHQEEAEAHGESRGTCGGGSGYGQTASKHLSARVSSRRRAGHGLHAKEDVPTAAARRLRNSATSVRARVKAPSVDDVVEIWSRTADAWIAAQVVDTMPEEGRVRIEYISQGLVCGKTVPLKSQEIRFCVKAVDIGESVGNHDLGASRDEAEEQDPKYSYVNSTTSKETSGREGIHSGHHPGQLKVHEAEEHPAPGARSAHEDIRRHAALGTRDALRRMISVGRGDYSVSTDGELLSGSYVWSEEMSAVTDATTEEIFGRFTCDVVSRTRLDADFDDPATMDLPCIRIRDSEVMTEIQKSSSDGAYFVLPSQLNAAEYPDEWTVVQYIEDYKSDNTGGPRGQLAVHPAVGQFLLDNAACEGRSGGISAIDDVLDRADAGFQLVNGYLEVPRLATMQERQEALAAFRREIHALRVLAVEDVPACGLSPDKRALCQADHKVNLVYASAVPVQAYLNEGGDPVFQTQVAEVLLAAQYLGALRTAAQRVAVGDRAKEVFLMPLGGGVFNNPWGSIAKGMSLAVEMLDEADREKLDIWALTWKGNPSERQQLRACLGKHRKLAEEAIP